MLTKKQLRSRQIFYKGLCVPPAGLPEVVGRIPKKSTSPPGQSPFIAN
jgi:hypothetical protein